LTSGLCERRRLNTSVSEGTGPISPRGVSRWPTTEKERGEGKEKEKEKEEKKKEEEGNKKK